MFFQQRVSSENFATLEAEIAPSFMGTNVFVITTFLIEAFTTVAARVTEFTLMFSNVIPKTYITTI